MKIQSITTGAFEEICHIVWDAQHQAIVFDPGHDTDRILHALNQNNLHIAAYVCTHGHADHINALAELHRQRPAPVAMHSRDLDWAFTAVNQIEPHYPVPQRPDLDDFLRLESSAEWSFADLHFRCIETPGHTPGSCCLLFPESGIMITGDTLFKGSCGRTDLPGGDARQLKTSLNTLKQLPGKTRVYPGHGPETTLELECQTNFFMK